MRKTVIVGLGRSGEESARLLFREGDEVFVTEIRDDINVRLIADSLISEGIVKKDNIELGSHSADFIYNADLMVISPAVRLDSRPVKIAGDRDIPVIGELELAYRLCNAPIVAVTGTSGKTTVTSLIGDMLIKAGLDAIVCGNIGNPLSREIKRIRPDSIVVSEVSSFQLESIRTFRPRISVILNISPNHLDRHRDMEEYISLKSRIFSNQIEDDIVFLNGRDESLKKFIRRIKCRVEYFDEYRDFRKRYNIDNEDFLAAMSVASTLGASEEVMLDVISDFKGIEHRLEYVTTKNGIDFINDSKATTVSSVRWALSSLNSRVILIMGGRYKGGDFGELGDLVKEKVESIIAIGEARQKIRKDLTAFIKVIEEDTLEEAVKKAFKRARPGYKILLSPGCSSLDMFQNYEERGRRFKEVCLE